MMDTILNLGLNDEAVEGLAARTGNRRFAFDSYRRLLQMFGEVVDGVDHHRFEDALAALKQSAASSRTPTSPPRTSSSSSRPTSRSTATRSRASSRPRRPTSCCARCARSSTRGTRRARRSTGTRNDIPDDIGTAVNVVQMVFGNKGDRSGTGVAFTRNPSTGANELYGEFLANAQGEDVVAGIRTPQPVESMGR